jgi:hypothetical protein
MSKLNLIAIVAIVAAFALSAVIATEVFAQSNSSSANMTKSFQALGGAANSSNPMGNAANASQTAGNASAGTPMASGMNMTSSPSPTTTGSATQ